MNNLKNQELWLVGAVASAIVLLIGLLMLPVVDQDLPRLWNQTFSVIRFQQENTNIVLEKKSNLFVDNFWVWYQSPNQEPIRRLANASVRMIFADFESPIKTGEYLLNQTQIDNYFKDELCFELLTGVKAKPQIFCKGKETQSITYSRLLNTPNHVYLVPVTMFQFYGKPPTELFERRVFVLPTATVVSQIVVELPTKSKIEFSRTVIKSSDGKIEKISWFQIDSNGNSQSIESVQIDNLLSILFDLQKHKFLSKSEEQSLPPPVPAYQISIDTVIESPFEKNPFGNQNIGKTKINVKIVKAASNYFVESRDGFDQLDTEQLQLLDAKLSQLSL